jgi:hypothetical protein
MKGRPIDQLVYGRMFPKPTPTDPRNFRELLQLEIVPEVRHETQAFYGHLSSQEAKYPGLDYSYQPHRNRLSRYPWHRRLFRAFNDLRLTPHEIATLAKWEGTRWAKERFEKEQGVVIRDTTADDIADWVEPEFRVVNRSQAPRTGVEHMEGGHSSGRPETGEHTLYEEMDEDSDLEIQSVGVDLNERLRAAVALREAGNSSTVMDEEWEQWLKDAVEAGGIPFLSPELSPNANIPGTRPATHDPTTDPHMARIELWSRRPPLAQTTRESASSFLLADTPSNASPSLLSTTIPPPPGPSLNPRARLVPAPATIAGSAAFRRLISRLDDHFADRVPRRPVPPIASSAGAAGRPALNSTRHHRPARGQPGAFRPT